MEEEKESRSRCVANASCYKNDNNNSAGVHFVLFVATTTACIVADG